MLRFRSEQHIYAQIIEDMSGKTLCSASTLDKNLRGVVKTSNVEGAVKVENRLPFLVGSTEH